MKIKKENYYFASMLFEQKDEFLDVDGFGTDTLENLLNELIKFLENKEYWTGISRMDDINSTEELFCKKFKPLFLNIINGNVRNIEENDYEEDNIRFGTYLNDDEKGSFFIKLTKYKNEEHTEYMSVIINFHKMRKPKAYKALHPISDIEKDELPF